MPTPVESEDQSLVVRSHGERLHLLRPALRHGHTDLPGEPRLHRRSLARSARILPGGPRLHQLRDGHRRDVQDGEVRDMTFADLLPSGMSVEDLLVYMSSLSVLVSVLAVWFAFLHRDVTAQRARLLAAQRRDMRSDTRGRSEERRGGEEG